MATATLARPSGAPGFRRALGGIAQTLLVLWVVSVVSFLFLKFSPGDPVTVMLGSDFSKDSYDKLYRDLGLDLPLPTQYWHWLSRFVQGDWGTSYVSQQNIFEQAVLQALPVTLTLAGVSLLIALAVGIPLGVLAAIYRDTWIDRLSLMIAVVGQAMPTFWFALTLIIIFSVGLKWLPVAGNGTWQHFVLPAVALGYYAMPAMMRLTRAGMLDVLGSDYIRTARAKGLSPSRVVFKHALRNAIIPVVALAAVELGFMLGGSVVIESVYSMQGLGQLAWDSISRNDYPVVQAVVLIIAVFYIGLTFVADVLNAALDPRMRTR